MILRLSPLVVVLLLLAACSEDGADPDLGTTDTGNADAADTGAGDSSDSAGGQGSELLWEGEVRCQSGATLLYDPFGSDELLLWPDVAYTVDDAESPTGRRLSLELEDAPWSGQIPALLASLRGDASTLSGFGSNTGVVLRFSAAPTNLPIGEESSLNNEEILWFDLSTTPPTRVPFEMKLSDKDRDLILWPLRPLALGAPHAIIVRDTLVTAETDCVGPSQVTERFLRGDTRSAREDMVVAHWEQALHATGLDRAEIAGIAAFGVHDDLQPMIEAAEHVRNSTDIGWVDKVSCNEASPRRCTGTIRTWDYRSDRYIQTGTPGESWELPITVWLPQGDGPFPFIVFGHGIGSNVSQGSDVAREAAAQGLATVAIDGMLHGEHPTAGPEPALAAMEFLGINLSGPSLDPLSLRGNFDQTTLDRLQMIEILRADPDVDGDGTPDLSFDAVGYWGISLGGMLGSSLTALSSDISASILSVAGGRLLQFATDTATILALMPVINQLVGSAELLQRLIPVAQSLVDPADPATWAPFVLSRETPPNILFPVALEDDTVPPGCGRALARGLGIAQTGPVFYDVEVIPTLQAPLQGNIDNGRATAGYIQLDRVTKGDGSIRPADHGNVSHALETQEITSRFLASWLDGEPALIIDPYVLLETPPLGD